MPYKDKATQIEYQRKWMQNRRREFFNGKSCERCGSKEKLELDHVQRREKTSHRIWSWTESKRNEEIEKCQVLCEACHVLKTRADMGWGMLNSHNSNTYKKGCRCEVCIQAKANTYRKKIAE